MKKLKSRKMITAAVTLVAGIISTVFPEMEGQVSSQIENLLPILLVAVGAHAGGVMDERKKNEDKAETRSRAKESSDGK